MKRRRSSLRSNSGQEERSLDTEHNLRKRKSINYHDEDYYYEEEDNCSQSLTHEDREWWPVSCGDKKGMMDVQKLAKSEECIECEGRMFTPPAFENFAGKGSSKKWKLSINSDGRPLQHWFDEGLLDTEGFKRGTKTYKKKGKTFQNNGEKPAHNLRRRDAQGAGESGTEATDDSENDDGIPSGSKLWRMEEERERDEEPDEMENDEDDNNKGLCAPKEPDPRLIISTPEKLALQMNSIVLLQRMSMTRSRSQTAAVVRQLKDDEEGGRDSEMSYYDKTKSGERENLEEDSEEPVESETADVATNTSPQQEPVEQKSHELLNVTCLDQFEPQTMSETRSVCDSDSTRISDKVETSTSGVLTGSDVDTMDLDQLQRETLKTQLEAAREQTEASRVQKEYYSLKLRLLQGQMKAGRFSSTM